MTSISPVVALFALINVFTSGAFGSVSIPECGQVLLNKGKSNEKPGSTLEGQWPWTVAIYQQRNPDYKYICGGSLVSKRHVITAAHCVTRKGSERIDESALTVFLGQHNLRDSGENIEFRFVKEKQTHPNYKASTLFNNLAILELQEPVTFSKWIQPVCLWSESDIDLKNIVGQSGSVVSWSWRSGEVNTEQTLLQIPVVSQETCIRSYPEFFARFTSNATYCAGSRDTCHSVGGDGMHFEKDGSWFLRGVTSLSVAKSNESVCDPEHYVIFADVAQALPWIIENIKEN